MAGTAGRSGGHNKLQHPGNGIKAAATEPLEPWPWERPVDGKMWSRENIFDYLNETFATAGIIRNQFCRDIIRFMADAHFFRMMAIATLAKGKSDDLKGKNALSVIHTSDSKITSYYRQLGVFPYGKFVLEADDDEEFDF